MGRNIIGGIIGVVVGIFLVALSQQLMPNFFEMPEGLDPTDPEDRATLVSLMPISAQALVIFGHIVGAFAASFIAGTISGRFKNRTGWMAGLILIIATITNFVVMGHNLKFGLVDIPVTIFATWLGAKLASRNETIIEI